MPTLQSVTRRGFLRGSAATVGSLAFPTIIPSGLLGRNAPSTRVNIGAIGVGDRSRAVNIRGLGSFPDVRIVACADPFTSRRERFAAAMNKKYGGTFCQAYNDFRELLMRDDIDGVSICTGDQWHVPIAIAAIRAGKDLYVEKPLGTSMSWAFKLREEAKGKDIIFQYGTQQRSMRQYIQAVELVRNGYIGEIERIDAWSPSMDGQLDSSEISTPFGSTAPIPVPAGLDYDLWLGPAPMAPYTADRTHHFSLFHIYDYSLGFIAGWGAHPLDAAQWGIDADNTSPVSYEGTGTFPPKGKLWDTIRHWDVRCEYANGIKLNFFSADRANELVGKYHYVVREHGTVWHGSEGWIGVDRSAMYSHHHNKLRKVKLKATDQRVGPSGNHQRNFIDCMRSRKPTLNPLESAIRSDTISHLSDISIRTGKPVRWDPKSEKIIDPTPKQNALLDRQARAKWDFFS